MPNLTCTTTCCSRTRTSLPFSILSLLMCSSEICGAVIPKEVLPRVQLENKAKAVGRTESGRRPAEADRRARLDDRTAKSSPRPSRPRAVADLCAGLASAHGVCVPHHGRLRLRAAPRAHKLVRHLELEPVHDALRRWDLPHGSRALQQGVRVRGASARQHGNLRDQEVRGPGRR